MLYLLYLIKLFIIYNRYIKNKIITVLITYLKDEKEILKMKNILRSIKKDYFNAEKVNAWEIRKLSHNYFAILLMELLHKSRNIFFYQTFFIIN